MHECIETARLLVAQGKGVLAADESLGTIKRRFDPLGIASTATTRGAYRELLFSTPDIASSISGVILFEETLAQTNSAGEPFAHYLARLGVVPGIKVDRGTVPLGEGSRETLTEGLDGLGERLRGYHEQGARFAKWRGVVHIDGERLPTRYALSANAAALAHYARLCQDAGLTPIVEPEVLMDGTHTIARAAEVTRATLHTVFDALYAAGIVLEGMLLKPNMVIAGASSGEPEAAGAVAEATLRCLRQSVPAAVPGIVFLSGGQSPDLATVHLRDMVRLGGQLPWQLSFSYGRALQDEALSAWRGDPANVAAAQAAFSRRAKAVSAAALGRAA